MSEWTTLQMRLDVVAFTSALVPIVLGVVLWLWRRPTLDERGGLVLGTCWTIVSVLAVNLFAVGQGWWNYHPGLPAVLSLPVPLFVGWVVLWGVVAPLLGLTTLRTVVVLGVIDLAAMPFMEPAVFLQGNWLIGEALLLLFVAAPATALARAQAMRRPSSLDARLVGQFVLFAATLLWFAPSLVEQSAWPFSSPWRFGLDMGLIGIASLPGVISLVEFRLHGATPWPWDRTERPIRSGPYRYVRSPMQMSGMALLLVLAALHGSPAMALLVTAVLAMCQWFSTNEETTLVRRWGEQWWSIAAEQRRWIPRWRPHPRTERAVVWFDSGCGTCSSVARWVATRRPIALELRDAAEHPTSLQRARYERADGVTYDGLAAFGAALEHLNLGWAMLGWTMRLPLVEPALRALGDASGLGPRPVAPRRASDMTSSPSTWTNGTDDDELRVRPRRCALPGRDRRARRRAHARAGGR